MYATASTSCRFESQMRFIRPRVFIRKMMTFLLLVEFEAKYWNYNLSVDTFQT